jgi:hypothetical protein
MATLHEVFLTRAEPASIGLSSIGARLCPISMTEDAGLYFRPGLPADSSGAQGENTTVLAPVAPGMVSPVSIAEWRLLPLGERVRVSRSPCTIALDGEREFSVRPGQEVEVVVSKNGPRVVMLETALREATTRGAFTSPRD